MSEILIALGANLSQGTRQPKQSLDTALAALGAMSDIALAERSGLWRTPALPAGSGPEFVNGAARLETALAPAALLARLHDVEAALGRARPTRWAPRVCDIDLLAMGEHVLPDAETVAAWMGLDPTEAGKRTPDRLLLPHPRLHERAFVLVPLLEIAPDWRHPLLGQTVREMHAALPPSALAGIARL